MRDPRDIVEIGGKRISGPPPPPEAKRPVAGQPRNRFLSIWFRCCHTYGRLYRNKSNTAYTGRCPRCGATVRAAIGPNGTSRRVFEAC